MNKKLLILSTVALGAGTLFVTSSKVLAYRGDPSVMGPNYTAQRHEDMTKAFANGDYNAWKELMQGKGRVTQIVNEQNFAKFAQMHQLMLEGKTDQANQIRTELGLGIGNGYGRHANR